MPRQVSNGPFSITTAPSFTKCHRCHRPVLAATVGGLDRRVDAATLTQAGELAALLEGRATFHLASQDYLVSRNVLHIKSDTQRPVLAEHACKEVPDHLIDHAWTWAAMALIASACGGTLIAESGDEAPPF
jgi:hypothetical protein